MIYLIGGSGGPNYGDELIIKFWLDFISNKYPNTSIIAESNIPSNSREFHNKYKNVIFIDSILKISKNVNKLSFWEQVQRGKTFFERNGQDIYDKYDVYFHIFNNVDVIHIHGGGYMRGTKNENSGFLLGIAAALKKKYNTKIVATGLGLMPLNKPPEEFKKVAQEVISSFDLFECRDSESYNIIKSFCQSENVVNGLDDNFLAPKELIKWQHTAYEGIKKLHLSFSQYTLSKFDADFWDSLKKYAEKFDKVLFWESSPFKDRKVIDLLSQKIKNIETIKVKDLVYKGAPVNEGDYMISGRFHPHFIASRLGAYGYFYSFDKYYDIKHSSVIKCGSVFKKISSGTVLEDNVKELSDIFQNDANLHQNKLDITNQIYSELK